VRKSLHLLLASLGVAVLVSPVSAHHSMAFVDQTRLISLEGVVTMLQWRNPHMWVFLDVPDGKGKVVNWAIEGPSSTTLLDSGISPKILKLGQHVIVKAHPPKDPSTHRGTWEGLVVDGKNYFVRGAAISRDGYKGELK
jgi:hypothetical protein